MNTTDEYDLFDNSHGKYFHTLFCKAKYGNTDYSLKMLCCIQAICGLLFFFSLNLFCRQNLGEKNCIVCFVHADMHGTLLFVEVVVK